ncbi:hypothetical protein BU23DRAFT_556652 [Bimuria novae-zelandiae CBS 107.79]|uniref:Uncharacterized protein n=1 Tax=Bimuria novae-zelandiae CBS 107.79 TaxID=1447943 RepID=A0A6A5V0T7_9PLEO|nr:hypothetical protein BU23DRAFT_556652 [Bimuria novae-zelandiae CBS 107.79]
MPGTLQQRACDCNCQSDCGTNCANGFPTNPIGYSACILACGDTCGCGSNTICCTDGSSCEGRGCCA